MLTKWPKMGSFRGARGLEFRALIYHSRPFKTCPGENIFVDFPHPCRPTNCPALLAQSRPIRLNGPKSGFRGILGSKSHQNLKRSRQAVLLLQPFGEIQVAIEINWTKNEFGSTLGFPPIFHHTEQIPKTETTWNPGEQAEKNSVI